MPRPANRLVRENLLSAGLALFHAQGFNAVGIKEITDTAGVPKGSFYSYYGSKNAFAAAVLGRYWTGIVQAHGAAPRRRRLPLRSHQLPLPGRRDVDDGEAVEALAGSLTSSATVKETAS